MNEGPNTTPGFDTHIRPLFREEDRDAMLWAFDLWDHADVARNADAILDRLRTGDMPCDEAWSPVQVETFKAWLDGGRPV